MKLMQHINIALHGINQNRLRGFLSILGVIVGVVAVIGMGALASSMQNALSLQAQSLGANTFSVERASQIEMATEWSQGNRTAVFELFRRPRMDLSYIEEIRKSCPSVRSVAPIGNSTSRMRHRRKRSEEEISVIATNEDFLQGGIYDLEDGRFLLPHDILARRYVCVIGQEVVRDFFPDQDPIGKEMFIGTMPCKVIGTLKEVGSSLGTNPDDVAIIPISLGIKQWPWMKWNTKINVEAFPDRMESAQDEVITTLRRLRGLHPWENNNFSIITSDMMMEIYGKITGAAAFVVLLIAGISLIVAGIGIMNVMFVSVKERTKEIGIKKACGASSKDIMTQFTLEAVLLSTIGGILGMAGIGILVATVGKLAPFSISFPTSLIVLGLAFSVIVGIIFGIIPAFRASKQKVVDSLRYE